MACAQRCLCALVSAVRGDYGLRALRELPRRTGATRSELGGMVVTLAAQATTAAGSGPRCRPPIRVEPSGPPRHLRGPPSDPLVETASLL